MADESNTTGRGGFEWGLASLAFGCIFALMVLPALNMARELLATNYRGFSRLDQRLAALGGYAGVALVLLLVLSGIVFGITAMIAARKKEQPIALGLAGTLLNGLDFLLWVAVGVAWHGQAWHLL